MKLFDGLHGLPYDEYLSELGKRTAAAKTERWFVGGQDMGLGHFNYAVMMRYNHRQVLLFEVPGLEIATMVVEAHNATCGPEKPLPQVKCISSKWEDDLTKDGRPSCILIVGKMYYVSTTMDSSDGLLLFVRQVDDDPAVLFGGDRYIFIPATMFEPLPPC